jgi:hypothetical protein
VIAVAFGIGRRLNATNLEFKKAKELEEFPARRRRDWKKIKCFNDINRQAYKPYINEKRIWRSIFLVQTMRGVCVCVCVGGGGGYFTS